MKLSDILTKKNHELFHLQRKSLVPCKWPARRDFIGAVSGQGAKEPKIIAEIKKASPSKGLLTGRLSPSSLADQYQRGGACALSVVTDPSFMGTTAILKRARNACALPVLRKDFIIDPVQIEETLACGADALLLIAGILSREKLEHFVAACLNAGIEPVVEVHNEEDLKKALRTKTRIIGINNRDLATFTVDLSVTKRLAPKIPAGYVVIAESGISSQADMKDILNAAPNVSAFLIGEKLMKTKDRVKALKELSAF